MYLLFAPFKKFNLLPARTCLLTDEVVFVQNVAYCSKFYWKKAHIRIGCVDISPSFLRRLRRKRKPTNILIFAKGGIGDSMWSMPFVKEIKRLYPESKVVVCVNKKAFDIWLHLPYINGLIRDEIATVYNLLRNADEAFEFGGIATVLEKERRMDPVDATFYNAGYAVPKARDKCRPHVVVTQGEGQKAEGILKEGGIDPRRDKIVMMSLESSTPNRNWPLEYAVELTQALITDKIKVVWLGKSERYYDYNFNGDKIGGGFYNLTCRTTLREAMSLVALADVYVGPSSGLLCIATSMLIPSVGLFGAWKPEDRAKYYDKFFPLWGKADCAPCREHWTECPHGHPAPCMKKISPELVYNAVKNALLAYPRMIAEKAPIL